MTALPSPNVIRGQEALQRGAAPLTLDDLTFGRPVHLQATTPPEMRGNGRDDVRLLISTPERHEHHHFTDLPSLLKAGDVLVINDSAVLPASLRASSQTGNFILNLSTNYGDNLWLAEPRLSSAVPGPFPLQAGEDLEVVGVKARLITTYPGLPRLWFVKFSEAIEPAMTRLGQPIRYSYVETSYPLDTYQTVFARHPGSAEMPSAARPLSRELVKSLETKGVIFAHIILHTGVSSLEVESETLSQHTLYAEPFAMPGKTAALLNRARAEGRRIVAVGTTVVRALESAWDGQRFAPRQGFTRYFVRPGHCACIVDGLLTGFHDPRASHLALLYALAGQALVRSGYKEAVRHGYLWHEFGDSHLLLP